MSEASFLFPLSWQVLRCTESTPRNMAVYALHGQERPADIKMFHCGNKTAMLTLRNTTDTTDSLSDED